MNILKQVCRIGVLKWAIRVSFRPVDRATTVFGLAFKNPVGLGAGFDKNALYLNELETLGFGFVEIGTVTPEPQKGNDKPRLFRLPKDKALVNRMGFNNDGAAAVAARLKKWKHLQNEKHFTSHAGRMIIGGNIGKNKNTPNAEAWRDYQTCFLQLFDVVDYFVVNVSSPNTPGLRELQEKESLEKILSGLQKLNNEKEFPKPLLLKVAPDLSAVQLGEIIELCSALKLSGIVIANTTVARDGLISDSGTISRAGAGGLSGKPLLQRSTVLLSEAAIKVNGRMVIIGSGGIFSAEDANNKLNNGAALLQVWTGFIYVGPGIVKKICRNLQSTL